MNANKVARRKTNKVYSNLREKTAKRNRVCICGKKGNNCQIFTEPEFKVIWFCDSHYGVELNKLGLNQNERK